jgi:hypothetical protein
VGIGFVSLLLKRHEPACSQDAEKARHRKTVSREASLVKRISQDYEVLRLRTTRYERRTTDEEDGLFEHPAGLYSAVMEMEKTEFSPCHNSFPAGS